MKTLRRLPSLVVALTVGAASPALAQRTPSTVQTVTRPVNLSLESYQLDNGLNVILSRDTSVPVVAVNIWYHVGSANEEPGRTGFAHLFEHMMFQGSRNVGENEHFRLIEEAGGDLNGSTTSDRTNYFEAVPSNFLERVLWQESDRMGFLLSAMTQEKLDNQRSVVQNERRQNYDNAPYGLAYETMLAAIYPPDHPYSWPTIGSLTDLEAASLEDVQAFFRRYYAPNNASLVIVGDFEPDQTRAWVERYFGGIPAGPPIVRPSPAPVRLNGEKKVVLEDRVQLPRVTISWVTPAFFQPDDADLDFVGSILGGGRSSRLYQRLVYEDQIAQSVSASQQSRPLGSLFAVTVTARPGVDLSRIVAVVDEEIAKLRSEPPTDREVRAALNNFEAGFIQGMQTALGRADQINMYATYTGDPAFIERDYARYAAITPASVHAAVQRYLTNDRVVLSVVPEEQTNLQAMDSSISPLVTR
ncbi:MAG: insulinase family protein [Gemmatimonadota bacterium]|jgi:zinc protease|nr:insulinase family protein [Gemmatimonadota bacterium]